MIISRTPFRISFFGGGTDYPVWYRENGGAVLGTTIDKYCYITGRCLPPFFDHKYHIVYSLVENVKNVDEIKHPAVRATLRYMGIDDGLEIHHDGDLPARTGLGSSSSFTVGLLHTLYALKGVMPSKMQLAKEAINVEQNLLKENVGCQDQVMAAFGGFNHVTLGCRDEIDVRRVTVKPERLETLQNHLMLVFTGFSRFASDIAAVQIQQTPNRKRELTAMYQMVDEALKILNSNCDIEEFGKLLHESWQLKRSLTDKISTPQADSLYEAVRKAGATGGKMIGAGGGGFMLFFVKPEFQGKVKQALDGLLTVPIRFESAGSQIIFYEPDLFYGKTAAGDGGK